MQLGLEAKSPASKPRFNQAAALAAFFGFFTFVVTSNELYGKQQKLTMADLAKKEVNERTEAVHKKS